MNLRRLALPLILSALSALPVFCAKPPAATAAPPAATEEPVKSPPGGTAYEIGPTAKGIRVPLERNDKVTGDLQVVILDVALHTERNPALRSEFQHPRIDDGGALVIDIPGAPLRQGTYDLRVQLTGTGSKPQILNLQITQPAAQLRTPDTLVIERFIGYLGMTEKRPSLLLTETSGHSPLKDVKIQQIDNPSGLSGKDGGPALKFSSIPAIPVGETGSTTYSLQPAGDLALGPVQGHAQILSPQLAAPVALTFEIRTRRTSSWILVIAFLGLFFGLVLRTLLPQWVSRDQARLQALDMLANIDREVARRKDAMFKDHVEAIRKDLEDKVNATPPISVEDLSAAITKTADALKQEIADLVVRVATAQQETDRLGRLVETKWFLPADLEGERQKARPDLADARSALLQSDAGKAEASLQSARDHLGDLPGVIRDWQNSLEGLLQTLELPALPVPAAMQAGLKASVLRLRGLVDGIPDPGVPPAAFESLSQSLEAIHKARINAHELLLRIKPWIETMLADVEAALRPISPAGDDPLRDLRAPVEKWLKDLEAAAAVPETATLPVRALFTGLDDALRGLLLSKIPPADSKTVKAKLDQQDYGGAAREVVRILQTARAAVAGDEGNVLGDLEIPAESAGGAVPLRPWPGTAGLGLGLPGWSSPALALDLSPGALGTTRTSIVQELAQVTWIRTALTWVGLLWLALVMFHDKAGTLQDFAEVFFWGFGTDVTVDAFWSAAKGYKKV